MNKAKKKTVKVTDKTPAHDPKGGGHGGKHNINSGGGAKEQHHFRFNPR